METKYYLVKHILMVVIQFPYLKSTMLCSKLSKGIGHNYYAIVIFGIVLQVLGLAIYQPYNISEQANPFATPLEILPEWYLFATFNLLRILPSKYIGVLSMFYLPGVLLIIPFVANVNRYQNPFRRPRMISTFLTVIMYSIWLSIGPLEAISKALPLM